MRTYEAWAEANLDIIERNGDEFKIHCLNPEHDDAHPSAYFNVEKGAWHCFSCGAKGSIANNPELSSVDIQVQGIRSRLNKLLKDDEVEFNFATDGSLKRFAIPTDYWQSRGLTPQTCKAFGLGYDAILNAATIPTRDIRGRLYGVTRRFLDDDHIGPRYKYPYKFKASENLFASWLYDEYDFSTVSIHEGAIDTMRMWQLGIPAIALYGSAISENHVRQMMEIGVRRAVYFGDSDKAGQRAKERAKGYWVRPDDSYQYKKETDLSRQFLLYHVTEYHGKKDAGAMTDEEILESWESKELYSFRGDTRKRKPYLSPRERMRIASM